jgi:hypothetical protein
VPELPVGALAISLLYSPILINGTRCSGRAFDASLMRCAAAATASRARLAARACSARLHASSARYLLCWNVQCSKRSEEKLQGSYN